MSYPEPSLIRPDHSDAPVSVTGDDAGFEPSFTPGNVPQLSVPDLAEDATGLSPEELAQVPTLTEQVKPLVEPDSQELTQDLTQESKQKPAPVHEVGAEEPFAEADQTSIEQDTQEPMAQADTWVEQFQVRMDRLVEEIHTLNERLDRLENKTKV